MCGTQSETVKLNSINTRDIGVSNFLCESKLEDISVLPSRRATRRGIEELKTSSSSVAPLCSAAGETSGIQVERVLLSPRPPRTLFFPRQRSSRSSPRSDLFAPGCFTETPRKLDARDALSVIFELLRPLSRPPPALLSGTHK